MQSRARLVKFGVIALAAILLMVGGLNSLSTQAGPVLQATTAATSAGPSVTPLSPVVPAVFPPCSESASGTAAVTVTSAPAGTPTPPSTLTPGRSFLGVEITSVDDCGVRILNVVAKSPAATGGLLGGDIIVAADCVSLASVHSMLNPTGTQASTSAPTGAATSANTPTGGLTSCTAPNPPSTLPILNVSSAGFNARGISLTFFTVIESRQPGDVILLTVQRKGQEFNFQITLGAIGNPTITPTATTAAPAGGPAQPSATGTAAATLPATAETSATAAPATMTATIAGSATASNATSTSTVASSTTTATAAGTTTGPTATP